MTTRSATTIVCECGYNGAVRLVENDHPYSSVWDFYSLEGFTGREFTITSYADMPDDVLGYMQPKCPECGETGKAAYAQGS